MTDNYCNGCRFEESECYQHQSDSGVDVYCTHPLILDDGQKRKRIGSTTWDTPRWCQFRMKEGKP